MFTTQKIKFSIQGFFTKFDKIRRKLRIRSHLLKKSLMENFIFWVMLFLNILDDSNYCFDKTWWNNSDRRIKGGKRIRREWFEFSTKKSKYL